MILIDANVMLRFLMEGQDEQWADGIRLIESGTCFTLPEVIEEVVYVLEKHYHIDRMNVREAILHLLGYVSIDSPAVILHAMTFYAVDRVDFVDGVLIARAALLGDSVFSFDKKVRKLIRRETSDETL